MATVIERVDRLEEALQQYITRSLSDLGVRTSIFPIMRPKKRTF